MIVKITSDTIKLECYRHLLEISAIDLEVFKLNLKRVNHLAALKNKAREIQAAAGEEYTINADFDCEKEGVIHGNNDNHD